MSVVALDVGAVRMHRIGYADVEVPADTVGLTADAVHGGSWAEPVWATGGVGVGRCGVDHRERRGAHRGRPGARR